MSDQKKESIFKRIKNGWNNLDENSKSFAKGAIVTGFINGVLYTINSDICDRRQEKAFKEKSDRLAEDAYFAGLKDGQVQAYKELLMEPKKTFKKMGMDVKEF